MPVMLPREFDADMRRDGSMTGQPVQNQPSMSAEECTACQDYVTGNGFASARDGSNLSSQRRVKYRKTANRRRRWPIRKARNQNARLGGQDKSTAVGRGAGGRFAFIFGAALHLAWRRSSQKNQLNQRYLRRHLNRLDALAVKLRLSFAGLVVAIIGMGLDGLGGDKNSRKWGNCAEKTIAR
jgi:hypothetical protein